MVLTTLCQCFACLESEPLDLITCHVIRLHLLCIILHLWIIRIPTTRVLYLMSGMAIIYVYTRDGPWPDPSLIWLAVNKRPTRLWPGYFLTRPEAIFFDPKGKKLKNLTFLGEIFRILTQTINGWPDPTQATKNWPDPGQKILTRTHH